MRDRATRVALLLLLAAALALAVDNFDRPLANPDEGRYSEISREMLESGDWVTPRLNGLKYFEKPPLQYWASALSFALLGAHETSARLYPWLAGVAVLLVVGFTARRLGTGDVALATVLALAASPYFVAMAGVVTLDMGLTLWTTVTLCALLLAGQAGGEDRARRAWLLVAWAGTALAVLSKGLVGIVFPAAAVVLYALMRRDLQGLLALEWLRGGLLFAAIAAPWFIAVSSANPEFVRFFFIHEHFERFLSPSHRRSEPWWYFIALVAAGFLPWLLALPGSVSHALERERDTRGFRPLTFALLWAAFVVAFFSASASKLPGYILPAFPAIAFVLGRYLAEAPARRLAFVLLPVTLAGLALAFFAWRMPLAARQEWTRALYGEAQPWAYLAAAMLCATALAGAWLLLRGRRTLAIVAVALGIVTMVDSLEDAYDAFSPRQSGLVVAEKMRPWLSPGVRLYAVRHYDQSVPFYIGRTMTLVDYADEFAPGIRAEPRKSIPTLAAFAEDWRRPGEALAIIDAERPLHEELRALGVQMQVLHSDPRRVLVRKP